MSEPAKVQMNFHAPVNSAVGNVQGDLYVNAPAKTPAEAAKEIQDLLTQLNLNTKANNQTEQQSLITKIIEALPKFDNLRDMLVAGGIETIKIICPPLGIPIEMGKKLLEAAEKQKQG